MKKIYGLQNDKEKISLIIVDDKPLLIIQTAENFEVRELNLEFDLENENDAFEGKLNKFNDDITINAGALKGIANNANVDSKVEITEDGIKTSSANKESQPYPVKQALKRIEEIKYITDVRIDEEFGTTVDDFPENRLTITIDYWDVDFVKEARKSDKYKLYQEV